MTTGYDYAYAEECSISVSGYCELELNRFSIESCCDFLTINTVRYTGYGDSLDGLVLFSGTVAIFSTDESVNLNGFDICCAAYPNSYIPDVVLTGGNYKTGNVLLNGQPICDDYWGDNEARVVCRYLGYIDGESTCCSNFGAVVDNFIMDDVDCNGNEDNIWLCDYSTQENCGVLEGAGVICFDEWDYDDSKWPLGVVETIVISVTICLLCLMVVICCWRCKSSPRQNQNNPGLVHNVHIERHGETEEYAFDGSREVEGVSNNVPNESGGTTTSTRVAYGAETMGYESRANNFQSGERTTFESGANAQVGVRPGEIETPAAPSVVIPGNDEIIPDMDIYVPSEDELNYAAAPVSSDPPAWSAPPENAPPAYGPPTY